MSQSSLGLKLGLCLHLGPRLGPGLSLGLRAGVRPEYWSCRVGLRPCLGASLGFEPHIGAGFGGFEQFLGGL